jgi:hypothetical protein
LHPALAVSDSLATPFLEPRARKGRLTAGEEVPDRLERPGCQPRRFSDAGTDYISLGSYVIVQLASVVGESGAEWDTEVVLSEGERLKFEDFFDLLDEILALNGFVRFVYIIVALVPVLERLLPEE